MEQPSEKLKQFALLVDSDLCVGCFACVIACKQENNLLAGLRYININIDETIDVEGKLRLNFVAFHCMHCDEPACIASCPEEAIAKRGDGIVLVDENKCTGCGLCMEACPLDVIQIDPRSGTAAKCHMCLHRIEGGLEPSCVVHCFTNAIKFGFRDDFIAVGPGKEVKYTVNCRFFEKFRARK